MGKIAYLNKEKSKDPLLVRCTGDSEGTIISCHTNSLLVHRLVYEVEHCSCFHLTLPSSPMLIWIPNLMRVSSFQRQRTLMCLYHSHVAQLSRWPEGVHRGFNKQLETQLLLLHCAIKVDLSLVLAKCEESTGREKKFPLCNLIWYNNNIISRALHRILSFQR